MSRIIEDEETFYIVRVIERHDETTVPFVEAQVAIKEQIRQRRFREQMTAYLDRLRQQTAVWTVFDDEPAPSVADVPSAGDPTQPQ